MKKSVIYVILLTVTAISLICCVYLYIELSDSRSYNSKLNEQIDLLNTQIEARNSVIDKELGLNINDPLSLSKNYEHVKKEHAGSQQTGLNVITKDMSNKIILPLYTPDGHYFGEISYSAYNAIVYDTLEEYNVLNEEEMQILHSYMNYITLSPGLSIRKY